MSKQQKLLEKLFNTQKRMKWGELVSLLSNLGYRELQGSGSRVKFSNGISRQLINLHKPHPEKDVPEYVKRLVMSKLKLAGIQ